MAGAGYKLFNTGDVLTAAQVNTYLQEQTVMVFASAAARTTALTGVVAEGMISYLTDTDVVQYYNGTTWTTINTDQTPLTTKGDLFTFSTQDARLAVGNPGETLVADSSTSTGLRWQGDYAAGKNYLINGAFDIWQRATSSTSLGYVTADRWYINNAGGTTTSAQETTIVPSVARYALKLTQSVSAAQVVAQQPIESQFAIPLAGQTIIVSAYVAASASTNFTIDLGTSTSTDVGAAGSWTFASGGTQNVATTTFVRVFQSFTVSGTAKSIMPRISMTSLGSGNSFYISGVQLEVASVATAFSRAGGTLAGELAACYRYYYRQSGTGNNTPFALGFASSTTNVRTLLPFPSAMRVAPTSVDFSTLGTYDGGTQTTITAISLLDCSTTQAQVYATVASGLTTNRPYFIQAKDSSAGYLALNAEL